jgi:hypothetical protein
MAMVTVLERLGFSIHFPEAQTCCGQHAFNSVSDEARNVPEHRSNILEAADYVVVPSGRIFVKAVCAGKSSMKRRISFTAGLGVCRQGGKREQRHVSYRSGPDPFDLACPLAGLVPDSPPFPQPGSKIATP